MFTAILLLISAILIYLIIREIRKRSRMTPEELKAYQEAINIRRSAMANASKLRNAGALNSEIICPQCQTKGNVYTKDIKAKKGISGAKATGAILTGGVSILATGLSRKEHLTEAYCNKCKTKWHF